jgi:hypothetical protein
MKQTAVEWLVENIREKGLVASLWNEKVFEQAKEIEKKETLKRQLFIGKVSEVIGFEKTLELWQETLNEII